MQTENVKSVSKDTKDIYTNPEKYQKIVYNGKELKRNGIYEGLPYYGHELTVKDDDPDRRKPRYIKKGYARVFDMSDPEDLDIYHSFVLKGRNEGTVQECLKRVVYDRELGTYKVYLEWTYSYFIEPAEQKGNI